MEALKAVLVTSGGRRHGHLASRLASALDLRGIVVEAKQLTAASSGEAGDIERRHLEERDAVEARLLGEPSFPPAAGRLEVARGDSSKPATVEWIQRFEPDVLLLFGCGIIGPALLDRFERRVINLHLGLSPYLRGSATNFWPLVERCPEGVGATIHLAAASVDAGHILAQVRPAVEPADRAHELGTKALIAAADAMPGVVAGYMSARLVPRPQDLSIGRVFRKRDFNADAVVRMWRQFESGMIAEYLGQRAGRCARMPIVEA